MENSIAERIKINFEGYEVGLTLLGTDLDNPILLVCGGGPGIPQYLVECLYPSVLPEKFVVCYFDYVACGASYTKVNPEEITDKLLMEETLAVTDYLRDRFNREKIYIMGHSFGTYIALSVVDKHPENYIAYLAVAQTCDQNKSEFMAYDHMKAQYEALGNDKMVKKLEKYNIKENEEDYNKYRYSGVRDNAMHNLGVGTTRDMKSVVTDLFFASFKCKEYTVRERIAIWQGKVQSNRFTAGKHDFNAFEEVPRIEIPVYFFGGKYDYTCCIDLQQEYYEFIDAPKKEFFLYESSAHSPVYEEAQRTNEVLEQILSEN